MRAGKLRHRITIEEPVESQDDYGEEVRWWQPLPFLSETWAEKEDLSGRELFQAQQVNALVTTQFTLRYRTDVNARMRIKHDGQYYGIESVQDPDGEKKKLLLICSRSVNESVAP